MTLEGHTFILTRPEGFSTQIQQRFQDYGARTIMLPIYQFHPYPISVESLQAFLKISIDYAIFVSRSAACHTDPLIWDHMKHTVLWSVGASSAQAIQKYTGKTIHYPDPPYGVLSLLGHREIENWQAKNVLVIYGGSDQTVLKKGLEAKGANVLLYLCYMRVLSSSLSMRMNQDFITNVTAWVVTSRSAIAVLHQFISNITPILWQKTRLVCTHPQIAQYAEQLACGEVIESSIHDDELVATIFARWGS